ncbi:cyclic nucleotide-gated channel beta-1-like [Clavelina lepadiformis]|uniref:cyclic nucleotide-gated channel beta-1-like n=1 Tax=Clavelina lepadiformis TaxID=159417 RepID=UPI0040428EE0
MISSQDEALSRKAYETWNRKCVDRARLAEKNFFNDADSSSDESLEPTLDAKTAKDDFLFKSSSQQKLNLWYQVKNYKLSSSVDPENDNLYIFWQFLVTVALLYNAICIPLRASFPYQTASNLHIWLLLDYLSDCTYVIDVLLFQVRRQYLKRGCVETDKANTKSHYFASWRCKRDMLAIAPTDLLYFLIGVKPLIRVNRLIKTDSYFEFNNWFEMSLKQAYLFRVARTTGYLLYIVHLDACFYYYISYMWGFTSLWGYNLKGVAYIRCYFWAFMTTVTIGNVPDPVETIEYVLQISNYFAGLFIFSIVIGQVRDSVQAASAEVEAYRNQKNACINYMQKNNIPIEIQKKVRLWFEYTWNTQKILNENDLLKQMPGKMHTELAINVHMDVLSKVEIFKECDRQLLYDLLLKLKPILYLPGDYVCKKGEVGREMYIITNGMVQVVGETKSQIYATLYPGTAFGEISLLAIGGGNRRTANIFSPGYTTLFILYKQDLNEVVQNYPEAQGILRRKAKKMLKKDNVKKTITAVSSGLHSVKQNKGLNLIKAVFHVAKASNKELKNMSKILKCEDSKR